MDPNETSLRTGVLPGAAVAAAAAVCMLAANRRTINPPSAAVLLAWWTLGGAILGAAGGWLGGRATAAFRRPPELGARPFAALIVGYLLLPGVAGGAVALGTLALTLLRRRFLPGMRRMDPAFAVGLAALVPSFVGFPTPGLPPPLLPGSPLAGSSPVPGSIPVTISVHTDPGYPELPATHLDLRPLDSAPAGIRASLWSGRIPARTRAGRGEAVRLPGGGGISRPLEAPGVRLLLAPFPRAADPTEPPFATAATLADLARASGIPVLTGLPAPDDPPHFLRILDGDRAPALADARTMRDAGAWLDVTLDDRGGGRLALAGAGVSLGRVEGRANFMDVTPTALHLLGLAIPRSCDGRVLVEIMDPGGPAGRPLRYRALGLAPEASASTTPR